MIKSAKKTLALIDKKIVESQEPGHRRHLGGSLIGDECARKLWYIFNWVKAESFQARMLRLFNRGHLEEARMVAWLKSAGVQIWEAGEFGDNKEAMRVSDCLGHFGATPDGVGKGLPDLPPDEPFLLEFKTHNDKSFKKLQKEGLMRSKWKHFVQMQVCANKLNLKYMVYVAVNKNDDDLFIEVIAEDGREGPRAIERAGRIIWSKEPPPRVNESPSYFGCKFCNLKRICHFGDETPDVNCRTCWNSEPAADGSGQWLCTMDNHLLDEEAQRAACPAYSLSPFLKGRQV